jgi:hypothetical protein
MTLRPAFAILAAACVLTLGACDRHRPLPSDPHANAPGSPGTGNPVVQAQPSAPDSPPPVAGAPSGSLSGADLPRGVTGKGTAGAGAATPGSGLEGGLASSSPAGTGTSAPMGAGPAVGGSTNTTTGSSVGNRP